MDIKTGEEKPRHHPVGDRPMKHDLLKMFVVASALIICLMLSLQSCSMVNSPDMIGKMVKKAVVHPVNTLTATATGTTVTFGWSYGDSSNLLGWHLYEYQFGCTSDTLIRVILISGASLRQYALTGLVNGNYRFYITAVSKDGVESGPSNKVALAN